MKTTSASPKPASSMSERECAVIIEKPESLDTRFRAREQDAGPSLRRRLEPQPG